MNKQLLRLLDQDKIDRLRVWTMDMLKNDSCPFDSCGCNICAEMFRNFKAYEIRIKWENYATPCPCHAMEVSKVVRKVRQVICQWKELLNKGGF